MSVNASKPQDFPIVGSFGVDPITKINAERTINFYEVLDQNGKKPKYLVPTPGLKLLATATEGVNGRAVFVFKGFAYCVIRQDIYRWDGTTLTRISDDVTRFLTEEGHVGIAANENEIAFVDNSRMLVWNTGTSNLTDETSSLPLLSDGMTQLKPKDITFMDGYLIVINGDTLDANRFYISALNDATSWDVLDFALVNSRPTILSSCSVLKRRVFLFGQEKSEIWLDAGTADFPFRRDNNLLLEHGVLARASLTEGFDRLFYLSNDQDGVGGVMMVAGGTVPQKISTREVDEAIQSIGKISDTATEDASGMVYKINGQIFYQINFTVGNRTFVYNVNTNKWHELESLRENRHIGNAHGFYKNRHLVLGYNDDILYEMSEDFVDIDRTTDPNSPLIENIKRTRIARVLSVPTYERIRIDSFHIDMLQGVGLPGTSLFITDPDTTKLILDPDRDPVIFLSISEDGGLTYENFERRSVGKSGRRLKRTIWRRLGVRRDSILKVEMYNRVQYYILGAAIHLEVLPE